MEPDLAPEFTHGIISSPMISLNCSVGGVALKADSLGSSYNFATQLCHLG